MIDSAQVLQAGAPEPPDDAFSIDHDKGTGQLEIYELQKLTEAELLQRANLDPRLWQVASIKTKAWNGFYKHGPKGDESHRVVKLYGHTATIRRRFDPCLFEALAGILEDVGHLPTRPAVHRDDGNLLYVLSLFDAHFGKYAWSAETGDDYDLSIADQIYRHAVADLVAKVDQRRVGRILLPIGQDFGHFDRADRKTTKGTEIDADTRWSKVLRVMSDAAIWAVQTAATIAPVEIRYSGGNHDRLVSYMVCLLLSKLFAHDPNVDVSFTLDPQSRQYIRWGNNALGLAHGDGAKLKNLPLIMAAECPFWSECPHREILTGHFHHERVLESAGITARILPSLSGTDWFHYHQGYVKTKRAALGLLYDYEHGLDGIHYAYAREKPRPSPAKRKKVGRLKRRKPVGTVKALS